MGVRSVARLACVSSCLVALAGCGKSGAEASAEERPVQPSSTSTAGGKPSPTAPAAARGNDGLPVEIPAARSAVPTLAEWGAVGEITVARSTPLNCETKMVREWLRVSCHGKNDTGGAPTTVDTAKGGGKDTYLFAKGGVTSVVTPVLRSGHYEASFGWTDKKASLVVDWPHGDPRPTIKFEK